MISRGITGTLQGNQHMSTLDTGFYHNETVLFIACRRPNLPGTVSLSVAVFTSFLSSTVRAHPDRNVTSSSTLSIHGILARQNSFSLHECVSMFYPSLTGIDIRACSPEPFAATHLQCRTTSLYKEPGRSMLHSRSFFEFGALSSGLDVFSSTAIYNDPGRAEIRASNATEQLKSLKSRTSI